MKLPGWISRPRTGATRVADRPRIPGDGAPAVGDGIAGATSGVAGNSRLTAATGLVLLVLLAVEGVTLLGVRGIQPIGRGSVSLRAYVANTLAFRQRKGTASVLEDLARAVTGWPAAAVMP